MDEEVKVEQKEEGVSEEEKQEEEVKVEEKEEEVKTEGVVVDPIPDINALLRHYNSLYFDDALGSCVVKWSSCLTSCTGVCCYLPGGGCEISLSEPLLKFRKTSDIKNTLLHEMIHAFLWTRENIRDHSEHGPSFQATVNAISSSDVLDSQRPSTGYTITIYHDFHDDLDSNRMHQWICDSCGSCIKRSMNKKPSTSDCVEQKGKRKSCGNTLCHWHKHKISCKGNYVKVAEPPGYNKKKKSSKDAEKVGEDNPQSLASIIGDIKISKKPEGKEERSGNKMTNLKVGLFPAMSDKSTNNISPIGDVSQISVKRKELHPFKTEIPCPSMTPEVPKRARTSRQWKTSLPICTKRKRSHECKNEFTVMSKWLNYYEIEGMHEDIKPLINKRAERRKKMKLMKIQLERGSMRENKGEALNTSMTSCSEGLHAKYGPLSDTSSAHATDSSQYPHIQSEAMDCSSHAHTRGPNKCTSEAQSLHVVEIAKQVPIQCHATEFHDAATVENAGCPLLYRACNSGCSTSVDVGVATPQIMQLKAISQSNSSALDEIIDLSDD